MTDSPQLNVESLPPHAFDTRSPVWWGNTLLTFIETMTVTLMVASYLYLCRNETQWPPPLLNRDPPIYEPLPNLGPGTVNLVLMLVSLVPMIWADWSARRGRYAGVIFGLATALILGCIATGVRFLEFPAVKVSWDDNAYGSLVWAILVLQLFYLVVAVAEAGITLLWVGLHGLDEKHAMDVTLTAVYWYWDVAAWIVLYAIVYWTPRLL
ncbi:MAG: heme-copper oxidase subunit III [Gemmataceae bacterium]